MNRRTRACAISPKVKRAVLGRDEGLCIFCGRPGLPEAHIVPRSHGGLGIEQNIVTVCRACHDRMDNSTDRRRMIGIAEKYMRMKYPGWEEEQCVYRKETEGQGTAKGTSTRQQQRP